MILEINIPKKIFGICFAAVGALVGFYMLPNKATEKETETNKLASITKELEEKEKQLVDLQERKTEFEAMTAEYNEEANQILEEFPVFMFLEDKILYADEVAQREMAEFHLTELTYGKSDYVMSTSYSEDSLMELYEVVCAAEFEGLTYPQLKELILFGQSEKSSQRFVLSMLEVRFDEETGYIDGEFRYSTYFVSGQKDRVYQFDPAVLELLGTDRRIDDLFGARSGPYEDEMMDENSDVLDGIINDINNGNE